MYHVLRLNTLWAAACDFAAAVFSSLCVAVINQRASSCQGTARWFSAALRVPHRKYLNLKWFHSYCKECTYLPTKYGGATPPRISGILENNFMKPVTRPDQLLKWSDLHNKRTDFKDILHTPGTDLCLRPALLFTSTSFTVRLTYRQTQVRKLNIMNEFWKNLNVMTAYQVRGWEHNVLLFSTLCSHLTNCYVWNSAVW